MKLYGVLHGNDGYEAGAWDEVRSAYLEGYISEAAYQTLQTALPPQTQKRKNPSDALRKAVFKRDKWVCQICGEVAFRPPPNRKSKKWQRVKHWSATVDHIVPWSETKDSSKENLRTTHYFCNSLRADNAVSDPVVASAAAALWSEETGAIRAWVERDDDAA